jgi:hypothetical protein
MVAFPVIARLVGSMVSIVVWIVVAAAVVATIEAIPG